MLQGLTDAQHEAVTHFEGPLLILAGPGSGKTRVVTHRVGWLLDQGVPGHQILALTFTNKAADEMARRIERLSGETSVWVGTFHRFCARMLRKYAPLVGLQPNYTIYDVEDSLRALRVALERLRVQPQRNRFTPEAIAKAISWAKNNLISPERYAPRAGHDLGAVVRDAYPAYQRQLAASNAVDFDDLLFHLATILHDNPEIRAGLDERYRFILVDEYQDTNLAQYVIARAMSIDYPNLAVTGDPDQSIYGWRGANLNNILEFERDFPAVHVVRLERNYRSTQRILSVAAALIARNVRRKQKGLFTENEPGPPVRLVTYATQKDEAQSIAGQIAGQIAAGRRRPSDFAIFYRVNALSRAFEFALREQRVPYQVVHGLEFFQRKEIKDILAYLHLVNNPRDGVALLRVINAPARGIGKTTVDRLSAHAQRQGLAMLDAARVADTIPGLGRRPAGLVKQFVALVDRLAAASGAAVEEILGLVFAETGYQRQFRDSDAEEDVQRLANTEELLTVARDFDERTGRAGGLEAFLEDTCLVSDTDAWEAEADRVTLMTLHASKGLEFPVVYLTAVEEGLLPHERSREHPEQLEEERRLMFVGITRARQELQISTARYRDFRGQRKLSIPSSFLMELPRAEMDLETVAAAADENVPLPCGGSAEGSTAFEQAAVEDSYDQRVETEEAEQWIEAREAAGQPAGGPNAFSPEPAATALTSPARRRGTDADGGGTGAPRAAASRQRPTALKVHLTTAAALAGDRVVAPPKPDAFRQGAWVFHPQHGLGQIAALSGSGADRAATVDFPPPVGRKRLSLSDVRLQPLGSGARSADE
jgi:DNA helicase-2/ATP-dependent DNA helicase PcrA